MTSGTPCLAARAARYFLLMSPNGCSTKLTVTPGCDCSNSGMTVCIETLSKYHTVNSTGCGALSVVDAAASWESTVGSVGVSRSTDETGAGPQPVRRTARPAIVETNATRD